MIDSWEIGELKERERGSDEVRRLRAKLRDREKRIRLARRELACVRGLPKEEFGPLETLLDLRKPLPRGRR